MMMSHVTYMCESSNMYSHSMPNEVYNGLRAKWTKCSVSQSMMPISLANSSSRAV